ncbi:MFS transporter [Peribacillus frigoritolerans]|jgi:OHS family lactose permease-like MFS transporter|uniref:MFS transporter n=1 Tax=Peribacillus frigoritolerans TaxID=450367 RepID=UPI000710F562|nr:MFS transporter [Peribacillus frigoritolerans]KRF51972.1 MFS transporter [Bacillus sp. Soil745]PAW30611.1 MFS transporter [Peribacillus simplex]MEB2492852.1 MFS transporter [Peribacillus frigoritolerans]MED3710093.1 MFS transporter [Peribacillus frigoritolerans]MED3889379.1 MFS transporter [Peribacillus frigoritolerans]
MNVSKGFWNFGGLFYFYFIIWAIVLGFLPLWLEDVAGLNPSETGIVFSSMSLIALCYQPFLGIISDKLGFKKNLFWVVVILLMFMGPFFSFLYAPLLKANIVIGAIIGSVYLSAVFNGGVGVVESYIERVSRNNGFEYGRVRLFGSIAGATASLIGGVMFVKNPNSIFWFASGAAVFLAVLLFMAKIEGQDHIKSGGSKGKGNEISKKAVLSIFKIKNFWYLSFLIIGTAAIYDVFDQQFPNYYVQFFSSKEYGTDIFSKLVSIQVGLEAILMIFAPVIVNKMGAKNGLILFGVLTFVRIFGSAIATGPVLLSIFRLIAAFEMPLLLVSIFKYITGVFDTRLSATIYLLAFNFAKQSAITIFSSVAGSMYSFMGFQNTYYCLSAVVLLVTLISYFTLSNDKKMQIEIKPPLYSATN